MVAVEPSAQMRAQRRTPAVIAVAEELPFDDDSFDAAMATVTIHQWPDLERGLRELRRVARGPVVILTFDGAAMHDFWLDEYVPEVFASEQPRAIPPASSACAVLGGTCVDHQGPDPDRLRRTASSRPTTRAPRRCSTRGARTRSRPGRSPTRPPSSAACSVCGTRSSRASGTRATATCARSPTTSARCASYRWIPPETSMRWPVTQRLPAPSSAAIAAPMSSATAMRPSAVSDGEVLLERRRVAHHAAAEVGRDRRRGRSC